MKQGTEETKLFYVIPVKKLEKPSFIVNFLVCIIWMKIFDLFVWMTPISPGELDNFLFSITLALIGVIHFNSKFVEKPKKKEEQEDE